MVLAAARMEVIERRVRMGPRYSEYTTVMDYHINGKLVTGSLLKLQDAGELILTAEILQPRLSGFKPILFPDDVNWELVVQTIRSFRR